MSVSPIVKRFWDEPTGSWQYVFHDPQTMKGAIVDPVFNFDPMSASTTTDSADEILRYVADAGIAHVVLDQTIYVPDFHTYGGLRLESSGTESLVVKLQGTDAGFTTTGQPLDITDRIGGILQIIGQPGFPATGPWAICAATSQQRSSTPLALRRCG